MTRHTPPAPDARPRCATCRGQRFIPDRLAPDRNVVPCPDCQPAPTPSGDAVAAARRSLIGHFTGNPDDEYDGPCSEVDDYTAAIRAESAAALQEARERLSALDREMAALSTDKETLMTATTHWRERAEKAEAELKRRDDADRINARWNR